MPETDDDLFTMTWEEAEHAFEDADAALLGTGSIEQHSVHLPVSVDTLRAEHLTEELVDAADDAGLQFVRLPTLPYGMSEHHMNFPGTITLDPATYEDAIVDIGESLARHGVERFVIVNCHGGNREPLSQAADRLVRTHDLATHFVHWTDFAREHLKGVFGEGWGHAGDHETSVIEHYRPDLVKQEKKEPQNAKAMPETVSYGYFDRVTDLGGLGDPTNSDAEAMAAAVDHGTEQILEALTRDIDAGW
ncbi:creatininase family protein [Halolamina litorea]|uniref:Creatininase family protein n=1 Tax=Halolamina litorea TaxID=1515593 RepID=A0ABD6BVP7_9EURY|nr:creatininase family protein [Halolamina litorea]